MGNLKGMYRNNSYELTNYIEQHWYEGKPMNFTIELEKDVDDLHLLLMSYQQDPIGQQTRLATFNVCKMVNINMLISCKAPAWYCRKS